MVTHMKGRQVILKRKCYVVQATKRKSNKYMFLSMSVSVECDTVCVGIFVFSLLPVYP